MMQKIIMIDMDMDLYVVIIIPESYLLNAEGADVWREIKSLGASLLD